MVISMKDNKGFTLVEVIIVVAVLACILMIVVPKYMEYVGRARREVDVHNAAEYIKAMERVTASEQANSFFYDVNRDRFTWHDVIVRQGSGTAGDDIYSMAFREMGGCPISSANRDMWWYVSYYDPSAGYVGDSNINWTPRKKIWLCSPPDFTKGYMIYPDSEMYVKYNQMVPIN